MSSLRIAVVPLLLAGCASVRAPGSPKAAAAVQAETSADTRQAKLWKNVTDARAAADLQKAASPGDPVRTIHPVVVPDRPAAKERRPFSPTVRNGVAVVAAPDLDRMDFSGAARVRSTDGEIIVLELDAGRVLTLQAKARGGPLRASPRDSAQILFRQGDPFRRDDVLALKLPSDDLVYALVGGPTPVQLTIPTHDLVASQIGRPEKNAMRVRVAIGQEVREVDPGQEVEFASAGLTLTVLASVAAQGEAANVLAEPYRLELLGWRSAGR